MDDLAADHRTALDPHHPPEGSAVPSQTTSCNGRFAETLRRACQGRFIRLAIALIVLGLGIWLLSRQAYGWHHLEAGKRELAADHFPPALQHFQAALAIWPDDAATLFLAAGAPRRAGDYESADFYLTRCQQSPSMAEQAEFERVLLRACKGEIHEVGAYCQVLLRQDHPETPLILEALAQGELRLLRFAAASAYLEKWLEMSPDHPQALFLKGRLQHQASNSQDALSLFRRAVELDPERDDVRLALAGLYLDFGQAQEGVPHLEEVCRRQPNNMPAKARLGQGLVLLNRRKEAVRVLDEVIHARPDLALALLERGKLAFGDGDLEKAQDLLQKACKREPSNRPA